MAVRPVDEIATEIATSIEATDPSTDTRKGSVKRIMIDPVATQVNYTETVVEQVRKIYQLNFADEFTTEEVDVLAQAFGVTRFPGLFSEGYATFATYRRPGLGESFPVPAGTVVGTLGAVYQFTTTTDGEVNGDLADLYFNQAKRWYEVTVPVEAISVGTDHDIAANRITTILTDLAYFTNVTNNNEISGGAPQETNASLLARISLKILGQERGTQGGVSSTARNVSENIEDLSMITPADISIWHRLVFRPALDIYIIGDSPDTTEQIYVAQGNEDRITLESQPVTSVDRIILNNSEVVSGWQLVKDDTRETGGSTLATDHVLFDVPLTRDDVIEITYTYNSLLPDIATELGSADPNRALFGTDVLIRAAEELATEVHLDITAQAGVDQATVQSDVEAVCLAYMNPDTFVGRDGTALLPTTLRDMVRDVVGVSNVRLVKFARLNNNVTDIEQIPVEKNQEPTLSDINLTVEIAA